MITHIATAATEQAAATEQVNGNMDQISRMVQQSAVSAEESAKACQDLSSLAFDLQQVVSKFKVDGGNGARRRKGSAKAGAARTGVPERADVFRSELRNKIEQLQGDGCCFPP